MTLVVNIYGGPGTGKSTTAAEVFALLKHEGVNCELAHEVAKDLTWEERLLALTCQPYVIGKQMWRVTRLLGQVDVIITDSPILLGCIYARPEMPAYNEFLTFVEKTHEDWNTLDIYLRRDTDVHPYNPKGRNQTLVEAKKIDIAIACQLIKTHTPVHELTVGGDTAEQIKELINVSR